MAPQVPQHPEAREILDAIFFYAVRGGCAWRLLPHEFLPHEFPPWRTVYYFRLWRLDGTSGSGSTGPS